MIAETIAAVSLLNPFFIALLAAFTVRMNSKIAKVAVVQDQVHTLVNSNMGIQLRLNMIVSDKLAALTKSKFDKDAALEAHKLYDEHMAKQAQVDAKVDATAEAKA